MNATTLWNAACWHLNKAVKADSDATRQRHMRIAGSLFIRAYWAKQPPQFAVAA